MKKIIIIIIIVVIAIIGLNFVFTSLRLSKNTYKTITDNLKTNDYLFNKKERNHIFLNFAIGNKSEQVYFYKYRKKYDLIVWNIKGFSKVDLSKIHLFKIENFDNIIINPQRFYDFGYFKLISEQKKMKSTKLSMLINTNANIIYHSEKPDMAYLDVISNGLILANNNTFFIKIASVKRYDFNFMFLKDTKGFHFLILSSETNINRNNDKLLNIIYPPHSRNPATCKPATLTIPVEK